MATQGANGTNARLARLEGDVRELLGRVSTNEKLLAAVPYIEREIANIARDCAETRRGVATQLEAKEREEKEERQLSRRDRLTIIGLGIALTSTLVGAVAALVAAGAFG